MTNYLELFRALAAPIPEGDIKILPKAGGKPYITARTVMNRLDDVLGPDNWSDEYAPCRSAGGQICKLSIRLPDGSWLTKQDAGGSAGMKDDGDDDKSAFSDALKRAGVKFGIARELYRDGVANLEGGPTVGLSAAIPVSVSPYSPRPGAIPAVAPPPLRSMPMVMDGKGLIRSAGDFTRQFGVDYIERVRNWGKTKNLPSDVYAWDIADVQDCVLAMAKALYAEGRLELPPDALAQMVRSKPLDDPGVDPPSPLAIDYRDRLRDRKTEIVRMARSVFLKAFGSYKEVTDENVMDYIQVLCREKGMAAPPTMRNLDVGQTVDRILTIVQDAEREAGHF